MRTSTSKAQTLLIRGWKPWILYLGRSTHPCILSVHGTLNPIGPLDQVLEPLAWRKLIRKELWSSSMHHMSFPGGRMVKTLPASAGNAGGAGSVPGSGRSPGGGNGNPLQYSCLENSMDRGAWWAIPRGHKESDTTEQAHNACHFAGCKMTLAVSTFHQSGIHSKNTHRNTSTGW